MNPIFLAALAMVIVLLLPPRSCGGADKLCGETYGEASYRANGRARRWQTDPRPIAKTSWPELVGKNAMYAASVIQTETSGTVQTVLVPEGTPVTMDYVYNRVRIFHDARAVVTSAPQRG